MDVVYKSHGDKRDIAVVLNFPLGYETHLNIVLLEICLILCIDLG